jgi:tRNA dimethylallyltransferase
MHMAIRLDIVIGCTASGKSQVASCLAERLGAEIVVADSMKVYRRMDIGTAKPTIEHQKRVRYHLIDVAEPSESFSAKRYAEQADAAIADIVGRGKRVIVAGGTALYLKALVEGLFEGPSADPAFRQEFRQRAAREGLPALHAELARVDPETAAQVHPNDLRRIERALEIYTLTGTPISTLRTQWGSNRPDYDVHYIGIRRERSEASTRINKRVLKMVELGLVEEVRRLLTEPQALSLQASQAVGYAEIITHLAGRMPLEDAIEQIKINSRHLAKAQRTWFRRFSPVQWFDVGPEESAEALCERVLREHEW